MRIETILPPSIPAPSTGPNRRLAINERRIVVAAAAGGVAFLGARYGVLKQIPGIGPIPAAAVTIALGVAIVAIVERSGTLGALIEGAGYGLVAVGALELAGS